MIEAKAAQVASRNRMAPAHSKTKLAMWFFLGSEVILFGALILVYGMNRINFAPDYPRFRAHLSIPLIAVNTFVLVLSSYFVVRAVAAAREGRLGSVRTNLLIVLALGAVFIGGQAFEWSTLLGEGIKLDSTFGAPFLLVTGVHGLHVLVGLAWASSVLMLSLEPQTRQRDFQSVETFGLYWHFVDIVWIVLFSLIYLL